MGSPAPQFEHPAPWPPPMAPVPTSGAAPSASAAAQPRQKASKWISRAPRHSSFLPFEGQVPPGAALAASAANAWGGGGMLLKAQESKKLLRPLESPRGCPGVTLICATGAGVEVSGCTPIRWLAEV